MAVPGQLGVSLTGHGDLREQGSHLTLPSVLKADRQEVLVGALLPKKATQRSWRHWAGATVSHRVTSEDSSISVLGPSMQE